MKNVLVISSVKTTSNCNSQGVFSCVCVCAHTQAHVCSSAHTLLCLCGSQRIALGDSLYTISLVWFLRHSLSWAWNSSSRLRCPYLLLSNIGIINICHHIWLFLCGLQEHFHPVWQAHFRLSHLPNSKWVLLENNAHKSFPSLSHHLPSTQANSICKYLPD